MKLNYTYIKKGVEGVISFINEMKNNPAVGESISISEETMYRFGIGVFNHKDVKGAKKIVETILTYFPKSFRAFRALGGIYLYEGNKETGLGYLRKSIELKPDQEREMNSLGYVLLRMKHIEGAIEVFKLNVETYPKSANCYDSLGEAYAAAGDKRNAIKYYQKALEIDPNFASAIGALKKLKEKK
jgi:Tfp pilus assembly protein PilF